MGFGGWGDIRDKTLCLSMASRLRHEDDVEAALLLAKEAALLLAGERID